MRWVTGVHPLSGGGVRLAAEIPGARFVPLVSGNHILMESEPAWKVFREELAEFLKRDAMADWSGELYRLGRDRQA